MHLSAVNNIIPGIRSMGKIKYWWMLPVYLEDILRLGQDEPAVWEHFEKGQFIAQKSKVPCTNIGRDHVDEQQNKGMKVEVD